MNPKEKAKELIGKLLPMYIGGMLRNEYSEEVALICVEEIIYNIQHDVNKYEWTLERS